MTHSNQPTPGHHGEEPGGFTDNRTVCGICSGTCGITLKLENGKFATVEGDSDHPVSKGHI